jgi:adenylate cyclase
MATGTPHDGLHALPAGGCELEVSVLFADVRGSTALGERLTPTAFSELMRRFYGIATDVLGRFGGTVDRMLGDGVMAVFLPGVAGADHARRAIDAAHALIAATAGNGLPTGVAVHTGVAWLGMIQRPHGTSDLTALGDTVNVTAHLCAAAEAGQVVVSEPATRAAGRMPSGPAARHLRLKRRRTPVAARVCAPSAPASGHSCFCVADGASNSFRYSPYPSASSLSTGMNRSAAELMQ